MTAALTAVSTGASTRGERDSAPQGVRGCTRTSHAPAATARAAASAIDSGDIGTPAESPGPRDPLRHT
ncbi:hypothetical protein SNARM312S_04761 [Streptomyces narbonensis]